MKKSIVLLLLLAVSTAQAVQADRAPRKKKTRSEAAAPQIATPTPEAPGAIPECPEPTDEAPAPAPKQRSEAPAALNIELTPEQIDSLVAEWRERQRGNAFHEFFNEYILVDPDAESNVPDSVYTDRLRALASPIQLPYNYIVRGYINRYVDPQRNIISRILGMSQYYFPFIEDELLKQGLPIELRALPIIESALSPTAVSHAGAAGLWQFMPSTGKSYGLEVNSLVDERRDPIRSTQAACRYLKDLYNIYKEWSLAIAAYNCGPGNVNKALRRAGLEGAAKKDFWAIYPYLPAETRGYVPCFIAATYVMNYYHKHNISPALAKRPILTDSVHVKRRIHFDQIAHILHIPSEELKVLNPQYRKDLIPGSPEKPCPLVLPQNQIYSYIMSEDAIAAHNADLYARRDVVEPATGMEPRPDTVDGRQGEWITTEVVKYHKVRRKETLASIAKKYGVTLRSLKQANGNIRKPRRGQTIKVVTTQKEFRPFEEQPATDDKLLVRNPQPEATDISPAETPETQPAGDATTVAAPAPDADTAQADTTETVGMTEESADAGNPQPMSETASKVASTFSNSRAKQEAAKAAEAENAKAKTRAEKKKEKSRNGRQRTVTVRKGDNMYKIAKRNGLTLQQLERLNPSVKASKLQPGDKLRVK